jgi:hypothetical protein
VARHLGGYLTIHSDEFCNRPKDDCENFKLADGGGFIALAIHRAVFTPIYEVVGFLRSLLGSGISAAIFMTSWRK